MAAAKEIKEHLEMALKEVGKITPWLDEDVNEWVFNHPNYPVEYGGESAEEVIKNYPKYLREFIKQRLNDNLSPLVEKRTKGHGGLRPGAGRPLGSKKELKLRVSLPQDVASWIVHPESITQVRKLMRKQKAA